MADAMTDPYVLSTFVLIAMAALTGCVRPDVALPIADLREIPQNCRAALGDSFVDRPLIAPDAQRQLAKAYRRTILSPWHDDYLPSQAGQVRALLDNYIRNPGCGENLLPREPGWAAGMLAAANLGDFPNCRRRAITVRNTSVRQLPTVEAVFRLPGRGEGFPFDRLQESAVWANTPLLVSHVSAGGAWVWVQSCFAAGWVQAGDVAYVDDELVAAWRNHPLAAIVRDGVGLRGPDGTFVASEHIGAVLPLSGPARPDGDKSLEVLAATRMPDGAAKAVRVRLATGAAEVFPVPATTGRLADLADLMLGQPYGWGGLYEQRDCSAMTRDLLAPFGVYLPRNSSAQAKAGKVVSLAAMSMPAKERRILADGRGMLTLLGAPGHIMLYLGQRDGRALIMHNTWGVKVRNPDGSEGRKPIGYCCITTLRPGRELPNIMLPEADLRHAIEVMVLLPGADAEAKR